MISAARVGDKILQRKIRKGYARYWAGVILLSVHFGFERKRNEGEKSLEERKRKGHEEREEGGNKTFGGGECAVPPTPPYLALYRNYDVSPDWGRDSVRYFRIRRAMYCKVCYANEKTQPNSSDVFVNPLIWILLLFEGETKIVQEKK